VLKLIASLTSPYVRKVRIVLAEKKIEYQLVEAMPWEPDNPVHLYSPLGKVPELVLDDGTTLYDSRVIVDYIDSVSPVGRLIPDPTRQRMLVRKWEALADGVCDATSACVLERRRSARQQNVHWLRRQERKIVEGVNEIARDLGEKTWCNGEAYSLADIATGCALGYLDFRMPQLAWRDAHPNLAQYAEKLAKRTAFADTVPRD